MSRSSEKSGKEKINIMETKDKSLNKQMEKDAEGEKDRTENDERLYRQNEESFQRESAVIRQQYLEDAGREERDKKEYEEEVENIRISEQGAWKHWIILSTIKYRDGGYVVLVSWKLGIIVETL